MTRPKFLDPSSLTRAERIVAISAWLGVVNAFVPWWFRVQTSGGPRSFTAGLSKAGTIAWLCFATAAVLVLVRNWLWPDPATPHDGPIYTLLGAGALAALIAQATLLDAEWLGFYVAVLLAVAVFVGGILRRRERRAGWR